MSVLKSVRQARSLVLLFFLVSPGWLAAGDSASPSLTVAHRGLFRHAPENTLTAFRACLELRTGFEFDVRRSRDGYLVCVHDATLERTTDGAGRVSERTLEELRRLDAGSWFGPAFRSERIPTVDEVFALLAEYPKAAVLAAVDIKDADPQIEADLVNLAQKHRVLDRLVFIGRTIEHPQVRRRLKQASREAQTAALAASPEGFETALAEQHADWVYIRHLPSRDQVEQAARAGRRVFLAGPLVAGHREENWEAAIQAGINAVLTDFPLELNRLRREQLDRADRTAPQRIE